MKKYFQNIFPIMLIILAFLIYKQWLSPLAPVEYYPPIATVVPQHLESIKAMDFTGNVKELRMDESPKTLLIAEKIEHNTDTRFLLYNSLNYVYPRLNSKGIRTIHLWITERDNIGYIASTINPKEIDSQYILTHRFLANNEKNGLKINGLFIAAYNKKGDLIYKREGTRINFSKIAGEIIQGVMNND